MSEQPQTTSPVREVFAGMAVLLVSVPLCLGIALASGAPMIAGLIAGIVGGLFTPIFSRSAVGVSGPAAGLAVIVVHGIQTVGYPAFLTATIIAGIIQIFLGSFRLGGLARYIPSSVINGMLAGIGLVIFIKQIPHAFGYDKDYEGSLAFFHNGQTTFDDLAAVANSISPGATMIALASIIILLAWDKWLKPLNRVTQIFQGALMAVLTGVIINTLLMKFYPSWALSGEHLVQVPKFGKDIDITAITTLPDFSMLTDTRVILIGALVALVASLETLVCLEATDKLDPLKRHSPPNTEIVAQGLSNCLSGFVGGLPITQVIVRSAANIQAGGRTRLALFSYGGLFTLCIIAIPAILSAIPLASLAAVLFVVGYKLARPALFKEMYKIGPYQFGPFIATIVCLVFSDLLVGIGVGLALALASIVMENFRHTSHVRVSSSDDAIHLLLSEHLSFLNKAEVLATLAKVPNGKKVVIDGSLCRYIDYDVFQAILDWYNQANTDGREVELRKLSRYGHQGRVPKPSLAVSNKELSTSV